MICTFFGHKDAPDRVYEVLKQTICHLIENHGVFNFYVGKQGKFDFMVRRILKELSEENPHIKYSVVLAYLPSSRGAFDSEDYSDTIYPEEIAGVPKRFAINEVNKWMTDRSDFVITCVDRSYGGAAKFKEIAEKKGKKVINIEMRPR